LPSASACRVRVLADGFGDEACGLFKNSGSVKVVSCERPWGASAARLGDVLHRAWRRIKRAAPRTSAYMRSPIGSSRPTRQRAAGL